MTSFLDFTFAAEQPKPPSVLPLPVPEQTESPRRLLVLADIHGNWPALVAVLEAAAGSYDAIWFLGDMVGYGPFPVECLRFLHDHVHPTRWRAGNHDIGLFDRLPGFTWSGAAGVTLVGHRTLIQNTQPELWDWFGQAATLAHCGPLVQTLGRSQQVWTHANLENDLSLYLFPAATYHTRKNLWRLREFLPQPEHGGWLLAGHTHIPCLFHLALSEADFMAALPCTLRWGEPVAVDAGHYYLNPGSVGQPRDGNPQACYLILDVEALTATWHRVAYPVYETVAALFQLQYPKTLADMLEQGGTPRTIEELQPYYRIDAEGLIASEH